MEWQTTEPPTGREIEFEIDRRQIARGVLRHFGSIGVRPANRAPDASQMRPLFTADGFEAKAFEVTRWREVE